MQSERVGFKSAVITNIHHMVNNIGNAVKIDQRNRTPVWARL